MKKLFIFSIAVAFALIGLAFLLPEIKRVESLPNNMIVTYGDIENANSQDEYSKCISLSHPKNLQVATNGELTDTVMSVKLFNFLTIKKVNVRLLVDTDVYVGGDIVGFNLFSEGVICVGSNAIVTENGTIEPIKQSGLEPGDAILKIEDIDIENIQDIEHIINLPTFAGKTLKLTITKLYFADMENLF